MQLLTNIEGDEIFQIVMKLEEVVLGVFQVVVSFPRLGLCCLCLYRVRRIMPDNEILYS